MSLIIGLTGGIASGKSTVSEMLNHRGFKIIDADIAAREVVKAGAPALCEIVDAFGRGILLADGNLDRAKLGKIIFHDQEQRKKLNGIVHPAVRKWMNERKDEAIEQGKRTIFLDIPLLYESNLTYMVEKVILVYVDEEVQLHRLMERNGLSKDEASARISSQLPLSQKVKMADVVIDNNDRRENTEAQLEQLISKWGLLP
ncbi:dephospho-CoA kinase [Falsibacillus albus]|uniref:Dephospho-CoA kinase n=1 Tax=Falsibacillus albus TaxID=2478915 RepID=A0A3L7K5U4_9BACI|nr:dephospho-CoA kinase [Falsibacillus albus]RLQ97975.1 dephospho-CoA kinase [Falsibacillus albus]